MIKAVVTKQENKYLSFSCEGHAGYDVNGKDIICAAVSMLTINTINSIEQLTDCDFIANSSDGKLFFQFNDRVDDRVELLMDAMVIGLAQLQKENKHYIRLEIKEVP